MDRDSIYRCEGEPSIAQQLAGKQPQTQFGRAMEALGVELILAHSPQAKGRVERMNGTLQDRLVKELRLAGISDKESANRFLDGKYLRAFHRQFGREAASPVDVHREVPRNLDEVLTWEEQRVVQGDWTVACEGKRYQLDRQHEALSLVRCKVIVRRRNGRVQLVHRGQPLKWRGLPEGTMRKEQAVKKKTEQKATSKQSVPAADHPWRRAGVGAGRKYWNGIRARGEMVRAAARLGVRDSGQPTLRSGLPASRTPSRGRRRTNNQGDILS